MFNLSSRFFYIQQGERGDGHLRFMYKPVIETLKGLHDHRVVLRNRVNVSDIPPNSVFVWVGVHNVGSVPWFKIRARGARTVYYQTEPVGSCVFQKDRVDEIWDFSYHNINHCKGRNGAPLLRYVPISYQKWVNVLTPSWEDKHLVFFGDKGIRRACFKKIDPTWDVKSIFHIWNEGEFNEFMKKSHGIFLNIHKWCWPSGPVTFRNSLLLSANGVIISSRCHKQDEEMYKDLILFVSSFTNISTSMIEAHVRTRDMRSFRRKFKRTAILSRAGLL